MSRLKPRVVGGLILCLLASIGALAPGAASAVAPVLDGFTYEQHQPALPPSARDTQLAEDANGKVLLFGGAGPGPSNMFNDTWEWDGSAWSHLTPPTSPPAIARGGMAYVPSRHVTALFGADATGHMQTWEFDGSTWINRTPTVSPSERYWPAMAASNNGKVVLFGGQVQGSPPGDTWEWDGSTWSQLSPATMPPPRAYAAMSFDPVLGKDVMFGGRNNSGDLSDTWEWDGQAGTWAQQSPSTNPPPTYYQSMFFDGQATMMFGGVVSAGFVNRTWEWNGTNWRERVLGLPPSGRDLAATAFNSVTGVATLFSGCIFDSNANPPDVCTNDTWTTRLYTVAPSAVTSRLAALPPTVAPDGVSTSHVAATLLDQYGNPIQGKSVQLGSSGLPSVSISPPTAATAADGKASFTASSTQPGTATITATDLTDGVVFNATTSVIFTAAATGSWRQVTPSGPNYVGGTAFDLARSRLVLFTASFGGIGDPQTWEWTGSTWQQMHPAHTPSGRQQPLMSFDATRGVTVLFGGVVPQTGTQLNDTWTWNGVDWTKMSPATTPGVPTNGVSTGAMAYDPGSHLVVVYNGWTWTWDGTNWTQVFTSSGPPVWGMHLAPDPAGGLVAFGGFVVGTAGAYNDTWHFAGTTWTHLAPAASPPGRGGPAMAYDPGRHVTVLYGGSDSGYCPCQPLGDTWEWNGTTWAQASPSPPSPPAGDQREMAYDAAHSKILLLSAPRVPPQMWTWDGVTWSKLPEYAPPAAESRVAYDEARSQTVFFGGGETWTWDGSSWSHRNPSQSPPARTGAAMVYDRARAVTWLYGGRAADGTDLNDLWKWDGVTWTQVSAPVAPAARGDASMAYDSARGRVVLFGGLSSFDTGSIPLGDTWEWDGSTWIQANVSSGPAPRSGAAMVFDGVGRRTLLFGGANGGCYSGICYGDTWAWDGRSWTQLSTAGPSPRTKAAMVYDGASKRVVLLTGLGTCAPRAQSCPAVIDPVDQWVWGGDAWIQASPSSLPTPRYGAALTYDAARAQMVMVGGVDPNTGGGAVGNDTWLGTGPPPPPLPASISPVAGPVAGGQTLTVIGSNFQAGATVRVDGVTLGNTVVAPDGSQLTGTIPPHGPGLASVKVVNPDQQYMAAGTYRYAPVPVVSGLDLPGGTTAGGTPVTVSGSGFYGGGSGCEVTAITFDGVAAAPSSFTNCSDTSITVSSSTHIAGTVDVRVSTDGGGSSVIAGGDQYTYANPASSVVSNHQYHLRDSDGSTWVEVDPAQLDLTVSPVANGTAVLGANADLWTQNAGYNQDLAIFASDNNGLDQLVSWKESGGYGGTFSPNAAFVSGTFAVLKGHTYVFKLKWKTNKPATGATIMAGAGPIGRVFSPTRMTAEILRAAQVKDAVSTQQYALANSNGTDWQVIDGTKLRATLTPSADAAAMLGGNADLWTQTAGYNQDLAVLVSDNGGANQLVGWKESGGFAGTLSPNAAFVESVYPVRAGHSYVFSLAWKTNRPASAVTIQAGAGPVGGAFSPTRLTARLLDAAALTPAVSLRQYGLSVSDGSTWQTVDTGIYDLTETPSRDSTAILSANADLWSERAGINQDLAIFASDGVGPEELVAWKESGGFAGTFSPNAAYVQGVYPMTAGHNYHFRLKWKANHAAAGTIHAGAGPIGQQFSPTSLTVEVAG